eukprot:PITA_35965
MTDPSSCEEEVEEPIWFDAMVEEYKSIMKNNVWEVIPRSTNKLGVGLRWIFKTMNATDGSIRNYKVRIVVKELSQVEGIDYEETFSFVARIDSYLTGLGFTKSEAHASLYHILVEGKLLIIVLCVDDLILIGDEKFNSSCKEDLVREFDVKDMGLMHYFLGLELWKGDGEIFVSQGKYSNKILQIFHMESCKPMETPLVTNWRKETATFGEEVDATIYQ